MDKKIELRRSYGIRGKCRAATVTVPLITDYE
jgi:hypothetical protein